MILLWPPERHTSLVCTSIARAHIEPFKLALHTTQWSEIVNVAATLISISRWMGRANAQQRGKAHWNDQGLAMEIGDWEYSSLSLAIGLR